MNIAKEERKIEGKRAENIEAQRVLVRKWVGTIKLKDIETLADDSYNKLHPLIKKGLD